MSTFEKMKRLIDIGLPDKWVVPVMEVFEEAEPVKKKRRKRRTKEQLAAAAKKSPKKRKKKAAPVA